MTVFEITVRCSSQPTKHAKKIRVDAQVGRAYVDTLAGLLDGSSPFYIYKPGPNSTIGKCATCGAEITAEVQEVEQA